MNLTMLSTSLSLRDYYIVCSLSGVITAIAVIISIVILILVWRIQSRLHTIKHFLMCNTCIASILYCIVQTINYVFLIFIGSETSDMNCRWRGYFAYFSISAVTYSYLLQAISRAFICVFSHQYRWLTTFRTHYTLILIQWLTVIIIPLPAIVTKDIYYRPDTLCWVPMNYFIHIAYTFFAYYIIPTLVICLIYIFIYYRVRKATNRVGTFGQPTSSAKNDLELLRNILILLGIYLLGGLPRILFMITDIKSIYLMSIISIPLAMTVEKVCVSILDRDIRHVARNLIFTTSRVIPTVQVRCDGNDRENRNNVELKQFHDIRR